MAQRRHKEDIIDETVKLSMTVARLLSPIRPLADSDEINIGRRQLQILFFLGQNGPSHARVLASELCMSSPTLSKMVSSLVKQGFIARDEDPNDRRAVYCHLLSKGARLIRGGWDVDYTLANEVLSRLSPQHISGILEAQEEMLKVGNTVQAETDYRDSSPQKQVQSSDIIGKVEDLYDTIFVDVSSIMPYELYERSVRISDIRLLQYLYQRGSMPMSSIARWMNIGQSTATGVVNRLVERGLVERERDHEDWRVVLCCLTYTGQRLIGSQWNPTIVEIRLRIKRLTYSQLLNLRRALKAMVQAFKEIEENPKSTRVNLVNAPVSVFSKPSDHVMR